MYIYLTGIIPTPYYRPMSAAKEQSLMLQDVVEVEESGGFRTRPRTNTGWVRGFPDSRIKNYTGDASAVEIVVTDGPDKDLTITYTFQTKFPVRIDAYARTIARIPKDAMAAHDMEHIRITRLSRMIVPRT